MPLLENDTYPSPPISAEFVIQEEDDSECNDYQASILRSMVVSDRFDSAVEGNSSSSTDAAAAANSVRQESASRSCKKPQFSGGNLVTAADFAVFSLSNSRPSYIPRYVSDGGKSTSSAGSNDSGNGSHYNDKLSCDVTGVESDEQPASTLYDREVQQSRLEDAFIRICKVAPTSGSSVGTNSKVSCEDVNTKTTTTTTTTISSAQQDDGLSHREIVLIAGPSGTGKTVLAHTIIKKVREANGHFISGKFDLLERPENYYPIIKALEPLLLTIVTKAVKPKPVPEDDSTEEGSENDDQTLSVSVKEQLQAIAVTEPMLVDMFPVLRKLLYANRSSVSKDSAFSTTATTTTTVKLSKAAMSTSFETTVEDSVLNFKPCSASASQSFGTESKTRLKLALVRLFRAISSPSHPLVLFLDDLQWAEPASIDLVSHLVEDEIDGGVEGLMILGAARGNEVDIHHPLSIALREMESNGVAINEIAIQNMSNEIIQAMIRDKFALPEADCTSLTSLIHRQTKGNILFVIQLLRTIVEDGLLYRDKENDVWKWDSQGVIKLTLSSDNSIAFIALRLKKMNKGCRNLMITASSFGCTFNEDLLRVLLGTEVPKWLVKCERHNLVQRIDGKSWRFTHDQIQQSAYSLIKEEDRENFHLGIGRQLWTSLHDDMIAVHVLDIVAQLRRGAHLITDNDEKESLAGLFLEAGEAATSSSSFTLAATYLNLGIEVLGPRQWRDSYTLSLNLHNAAAEVEYCNANFKRTDTLVRHILENARDRTDKMRALTLSLYSQGSQNHLQEAIEFGLTLLKDLGHPFPTTMLPLRIVHEIAKTDRMLKGVTEESLLNLPTMTDPKLLAVYRIQVNLLLYAFVGFPMLVPLLTMKMVQMSLKHGLCGMASVPFSALGQLRCGPFRDYESGLRLSVFGLKILEKYNAKEWLARVYCSVHGVAFTLTQPLRMQLKPLLYAHRVGLGCGDIESAALAACFYNAISINASMNLHKVWTDTVSNRKLLTIYKQWALLEMTKPQVQFVANMNGRSENPLILTGDVMDEGMMIKNSEAMNNFVIKGLILFYKLQLAVYFHDYARGEQVMAQFTRKKLMALAPYNFNTISLMKGLVYASAKNKCPRRQKKSLKACINELEFYKKFCANTVLSKLYILEAELLVLSGNVKAALIKYDASIADAAKESLWTDYSLACERAYRALMLNGIRSDAYEYLKKALYGYEMWGAVPKINEIKAELLALEH